MSERLIEKIDRLGTEAGVETMTPEIRRFALLVRQDTVAQWPDLTEQQRESYQKGHNDGVAHHKQAVKAAQPEQEEDWDAMGQKILAATARDTKRTWEDAAVRAVNKSMQQEQEPIAYLCENAVGHKYFRWKKPSSTYKPIALYTTPPVQPEHIAFLSGAYEIMSKHCDELMAQIRQEMKNKADQAKERNFCPRCGKRTPDLAAIHTCTPPKENNT